MIDYIFQFKYTICPKRFLLGNYIVYTTHVLITNASTNYSIDQRR